MWTPLFANNITNLVPLFHKFQCEIEITLVDVFLLFSVYTINNALASFSYKEHDLC